MNWMCLVQGWPKPVNASCAAAAVEPQKSQNRLKPFLAYLFAALAAIASERQALADQVTEVKQYGIAWKFEKPVTAGQYITGDWWVVGPVKIVGITPAPSSASADEPSLEGKSRYGAPAFKSDTRMRNGSMVSPQPAGDQGYDSRMINYNPAKSVQLPLTLSAGESLVSTQSATAAKPGKDGSMQLATPFILGQGKFPLCSAELPLTLQSAAVLTCVAKEPPKDAFRPSYTGVPSEYREKDLHWNLLPKLSPVDAVPSWQVMERIFQRPWLDHDSSWLIQHWAPGENQPNYGREFARMTSIAGLMLLLDVPQEHKRTLMIEYVQLGIDLSGLAQKGRNWYSDGGHWQGRKWPILFASLMLGDEKLRAFPEVDRNKFLYGRIRLDPSAQATTTLFQEDLDSYYGAGGDGQKVLWQSVYHTGPRPPYQEKPRAEFTKADLFVDGYYINNAASWIGSALSAQHMKAKSIWNHDAYFDLIDQWMQPEVSADIPKWLPKGCTRGVDLFIEQMWAKHRASVPAQAGGKDNLKWVYTDGSVANDRFSATLGRWESNAPASKGK